MQELTASPSTKNRVQVPRSSRDPRGGIEFQPGFPFQDVISRLKQVALASPHAVAVECDGCAVRYAELVENVDALSKRLTAKGVRPSEFVAISITDKLHAITAMIAVLQVGGVFVYFDPDHPEERRREMWDDLHPALLLTDGNTSFLDADDVRVLRWTDIEQTSNGENENPSEIILSPTSPAYAIFTSGSTGKPKAVLLQHGGLSNLVQAQRELFRITPGSRVLQFAPLTFDASISEVFVTLCAGGTLVLGERKQLIPGESLWQTLSEQQISAVTMPPSVLSMLPRKPLPKLETLVVAGERCAAEVVRTWAPGRRFLNAYGPSETTVCATAWVCDDERLRDAPPIGTALPGCHLLVLDHRLLPVEPGDVGELYVGGEQVGLGYMHRPEATVEHFLDRSRFPHHNLPCERYYKTGDLVRERNDGVLEYCGRRDDQVKIRGVRIELDEINHTLEMHPHVVRAVTYVDDQRGFHPHLVTVAHVQGSVAVEELISFARRKLPLAMIPSVCHLVTEPLPLTRHGKVDRKRLRELVAHNELREASVEQAPPSDYLEAELVQLWADSLRVEQVGVDHDFFVLGGDSLAMMDLLAQVEERWNCRISLSEFLGDPSIHHLAELIRGRRNPADWTPLVPLRPRGTGQPIFFVHPGGGNVLCYLDLARELDVDRPLYALQAPGIDGICETVGSIDEMAQRYIQAIKTVQPHGPYTLAGWSYGGIVAHAMATKLQQRHEIVERLVVLDAGIMHSFAVLREIFPFDNISLPDFISIAPDKLLPHFTKRARANGVIPPNSTDIQAERFFRIFRENINSLVEHRPDQFRGTLTLIEAKEPLVKTRRTLESEWKRLADRVEVLTTSGNHLNLLMKPHVHELAGLAKRIFA